MYPRIARWRKAVWRKYFATLLLRRDHTGPQTLTHNPMETPGPRDSAGKV
jgi:hypothetical protein